MTNCRFVSFIAFSLFLSLNCFAGKQKENYVDIKTKVNHIGRYSDEQKSLIFEHLRLDDKNLKLDSKLLDSSFQEMRHNAEGAELNFHNRIKKMAKKLQVAFDGTILQFPFRGYEIPLLVETKYGENFLRVEGVLKESQKLSGEEESCLSLIVQEKNMHISFLATAYKACPIPTNRSGTFLLQLAEQIAKTLEMDQIDLRDISQIMCHRGCNTWMSFRLLNILKNGNTWYGAHGYTTMKGYEEDKRRNEAIKNYPLILIKNDFNSITSATLNNLKNYLLSSHSNDFEKSMIEGYFKEISIDDFTLFNEKFEEYLMCLSSHENLFLGDYLLWLWKNDCVAYRKIINIVFPSSQYVSGLGINHLLDDDDLYYRILSDI